MIRVKHEDGLNVIETEKGLMVVQGGDFALFETAMVVQGGDFALFETATSQPRLVEASSDTFAIYALLLISDDMSVG